MIYLFFYTHYSVKPRIKKKKEILALMFSIKTHCGSKMLANTLRFMVKYSPEVSFCPSQLVIYQGGRQANNLLE